MARLRKGPFLPHRRAWRRPSRHPSPNRLPACQPDGLPRRHAQVVEATTGIEPVYAVMQSPPERAPLSAHVRHSCLGRPLVQGSVRRRCYQPLLPSAAALPSPAAPSGRSCAPSNGHRTPRLISSKARAYRSWASRASRTRRGGRRPTNIRISRTSQIGRPAGDRRLRSIVRQRRTRCRSSIRRAQHGALPRWWRDRCGRYPRPAC